MPHPVRKLRHWKQRYDENADFVCRRPLFWKGKRYERGDPIPKDLKEMRGKLRRFWESGAIELAEFEAPDVLLGRAKRPADIVVKEGDREWRVAGLDEETFKTKKAALGAASELLATRKAGNRGQTKPGTPAKKEPAPKSDGLDELKMAELKKIADNLGVSYKPVGQRKDELVAAIREAQAKPKEG